MTITPTKPRMCSCGAQMERSPKGAYTCHHCDQPCETRAGCVECRAYMIGCRPKGQFSYVPPVYE